jgi:hypothetical protein
VVWSPKVCLAERRRSVWKLSDVSKAPSIDARAATFEGGDHNSVDDPVRGHQVPDSLQAVANAIVHHVAQVSFQKLKISRMVLNFKVMHGTVLSVLVNVFAVVVIVTVAVAGCVADGFRG